MYPSQTQYLTRDYVGVRCRFATKPIRYILDPDDKEPIFVVKAGEEVVELEPEVGVFTEEGKQIQPEGRFFRTVRTINPYHAILDIWDFGALRR